MAYAKLGPPPDPRIHWETGPAAPTYLRGGAPEPLTVLAYLRELADHLGWVETDGLGNGQKLDHVHRPLPSFQPRNPRLMLMQSLRDIGLIKAFGNPLLSKPPRQHLVSFGHDRFHQIIMNAA